MAAPAARSATVRYLLATAGRLAGGLAGMCLMLFVSFGAVGALMKLATGQWFPRGTADIVSQVAIVGFLFGVAGFSLGFWLVLRFGKRPLVWLGVATLLAIVVVAFSIYASR